MKTIATFRSLAIALFTTAFLSSAIAAESKPSAASTAFAKLKELAGDWKGESGEEGKKLEVFVQYKVTSNGSVVMETLFPGTPHEMVTVYYLDGDNLVLVHYCAVGNQPRLRLKKSTSDSLEFDFAGGSNIEVSKDAHMHALKLTFEGKEKITAAWDYFKGGRKVDVTKFTVTRKAS
jgi:hypothetical protein